MDTVESGYIIHPPDRTKVAADSKCRLHCAKQPNPIMLSRTAALR